MGMREVSNKVLYALEEGHSRDEVYNMLSSAKPADAGKIAYCIASVPTHELRQKYLRFNAALCLLLLIYPVINLVSELPIDFSQPTLFILIRCVLPLVFAYFVFRFHGGIYRLAGIWFLLDLVESLLLTGAPDGMAAVKLLVLFVIVWLSFTIARKVFPNLGIIGPRKNQDGTYML